jgi:hypothetical protein
VSAPDAGYAGIPGAGCGDEGLGLGTQERCGGHAGLGAEVRAVAVAVLDRIGPALDEVRAAAHPPGSADDAPDGPGPDCGACPVCAVIAVVRREHPELAARVAEHVAGALAVLRAALDEGDPPASAAAAEPPTPPAPSAATERRVQRIPVERSRVAR